MNQAQWTAVDQYLAETLLPPDPILEASLQLCAGAGLPAISVSPNQGKLLQLLALAQGARRILEVGTLGGYSTIWLARALPPNGRLITLESEAKHAAVARANLARARVTNLVDIRTGPALELMSDLVLEQREPFDFIFIDADKENYPGYFQWAFKLSRPGTIIIADNVVRNGEVINPDHNDPRVQGVREFHRLVAAERKVSATTIQTVGSKGYDGFTMLVVDPDGAKRIRK